jgi:PncC family amidohydrolase
LYGYFNTREIAIFICYNKSMMDEALETLIGRLLKQAGLSLAAAESCTGGLLSHRLTNVPGASDYFLGAIIAYANQIKTQHLDVRQETLQKHGAVSEETVLEMARGVRLNFNADIGVAISGIAGPSGGTPQKPVGLTWIGLSTIQTEKAWHFIWPGDRLAVKEQAANQTLQLLADFLINQYPNFLNAPVPVQ